MCGGHEARFVCKYCGSVPHMGIGDPGRCVIANKPWLTVLVCERMCNGHCETI